MLHIPKQKIVYRLVQATMWDCINAQVSELSKPKYTRNLRRAMNKAAAELEAAKKAGKPAPPLAAPPPKPVVLLCQSKQGTAGWMYRLALQQLGLAGAKPLGPRSAERREYLRRHGVPKKTTPPRKPKPFDSVSRELRLTTTQAGLAMTCGNSTRTLQRHLDDFEALALVKVRQKLAQGKYPTPSFQLVLNADFFDWEEIELCDNSPRAYDSVPAGAPAAAQGPTTAASGPEPPGTPALEAATVTALMALRQKMTAWNK